MIIWPTFSSMDKLERISLTQDWVGIFFDMTFVSEPVRKWAPERRSSKIPRHLTIRRVIENEADGPLLLSEQVPQGFRNAARLGILPQLRRHHNNRGFEYPR